MMIEGIDMTQQLIPVMWFWVGLLVVGALAWLRAARPRPVLERPLRPCPVRCGA